MPFEHASRQVGASDVAVTESIGVSAAFCLHSPAPQWPPPPPKEACWHNQQRSSKPPAPLLLSSCHVLPPAATLPLASPVHFRKARSLRFCCASFCSASRCCPSSRGLSQRSRRCPSPWPCRSASSRWVPRRQCRAQLPPQRVTAAAHAGSSQDACKPRRCAPALHAGDTKAGQGSRCAAVLRCHALPPCCAAGSCTGSLANAVSHHAQAQPPIPHAARRHAPPQWKALKPRPMWTTSGTST